MNRRVLLAGGLALGGAAIGANVNRTRSLRSNFAQSRILSFTREPLLVAMLESHASRIAPLIPEIESALNRSLSIEALPADQLYANYTIDLLQQTGRYDAVSMNDAWIPYFGRRGYLTAVPELESEENSPSYPVRIHASARGVDGTELVAYPWTFDYTCAAMESRLGLQDWSRNWTNFFPAAASLADAQIGVALRAPASAAETYRSILLSYGDDLVSAETHQPRLDSYAARRALETTIRLANLGDPESSMTRSLTQLAGLGLSGEAEILPVIWAADTKRLWANGDWTFELVPTGRMGRAVTAATFWMWGVPAGAPSVEKARSFVQIMTSLDIQSKLWSSGGLLPAIRPALNSAWEPGETAMRRLTLAALDRSRFRPQLRAFRSLMDIAGQMVVDAMSGTDDAESIRLRANEQMRTELIQEGELKS